MTTDELVEKIRKINSQAWKSIAECDAESAALIRKDRERYAKEFVLFCKKPENEGEEYKILIAEFNKQEK